MPDTTGSQARSVVPSISIEVRSAARDYHVLIDGSGCTFSNGRAYLKLQSGRHDIHWLASGKPGEAFRLEVLSGNTSVLVLETAVSSHGRIAGHATFLAGDDEPY